MIFDIILDAFGSAKIPITIATIILKPFCKSVSGFDRSINKLLNISSIICFAAIRPSPIVFHCSFLPMLSPRPFKALGKTQDIVS